VLLKLRIMLPYPHHTGFQKRGKDNGLSLRKQGACLKNILRYALYDRIDK